MNLSIKNVPEELVARLRERAQRNHRSLQGEMMSILEAAVGTRGKRSAIEIFEEIKRMGVQTEADSVEIIRNDRDGR